MGKYFESKKVLENYRTPHNTGRLEKFTHEAEEINPLCGDEIRVYLRVQNSAIKDISHETSGCVLAVASASVLSDYAKGKSVNQLKNLKLTNIEKLLGSKVPESRRECILLPLRAIQKGLK